MGDVHPNQTFCKAEIQLCNWLSGVSFQFRYLQNTVYSQLCNISTIHAMCHRLHRLKKFPGGMYKCHASFGPAQPSTHAKTRIWNFMWNFVTAFWRFCWLKPCWACCTKVKEAVHGPYGVPGGWEIVDILAGSFIMHMIRALIDLSTLSLHHILNGRAIWHKKPHNIDFMH